MKTRRQRSASLASVFLSGLAATTLTQTVTEPVCPLAANVIVPQVRAFAVDSSVAAEITGIDVGVVIVEQVATTTLDLALRNPSPHRIEAELLVPVPPGAVVRGSAFEGGGAKPTARVLPKDEARWTYDAIVAKARDPALLEFAGYNLIRSNLLPIPPRGTQKVRLTHKHLLPCEDPRMDYGLPRSEVLGPRAPWNVAVKIESARPISTVYSPSHELDIVRNGPNAVSARTTPEASTQPGPFRLSCLLGGDGVCASLLGYPEPSGGGGYFLLLAGLPAGPPAGAADRPLRRDITLVLDHSGSMAGEKIEQVRAAALQVVAGLGDGEQNLAPRRVVEFGSPEFRALADRLAAESRQGALALPDDVLLFDHDELILVKAPPPAP